MLHLGYTYHIKSPALCTCPCIADHLKPRVCTTTPYTQSFSYRMGGFSFVVCWGGEIWHFFSLFFRCTIFSIADVRCNLSFPPLLELLKDENKLLVLVTMVSVTNIITSYKDSRVVVCLHFNLFTL